MHLCKVASFSDTQRLLGAFDTFHVPRTLPPGFTEHACGRVIGKFYYALKPHCDTPVFSNTYSTDQNHRPWCRQPGPLLFMNRPVRDSMTHMGCYFSVTSTTLRHTGVPWI